MNPLNMPFDSKTVNLTDAATFAPVGPRINADGRTVSIHGKNGAGALTDIRISTTSLRDGVLVPLSSGAGLVGDVMMRPGYPDCLAAGADWEAVIDVGAADVLVEAKGAATSLRVTGMVI